MAVVAGVVLERQADSAQAEQAAEPLELEASHLAAELGRIHWALVARIFVAHAKAINPSCQNCFQSQ